MDFRKKLESDYKSLFDIIVALSQDGLSAQGVLTGIGQGGRAGLGVNKHSNPSVWKAGNGVGIARSLDRNNHHR